MKVEQATDEQLERFLLKLDESDPDGPAAKAIRKELDRREIRKLHPPTAQEKAALLAHDAKLAAARAGKVAGKISLTILDRVLIMIPDLLMAVFVAGFLVLSLGCAVASVVSLFAASPAGAGSFAAASGVWTLVAIMASSIHNTEYRRRREADRLQAKENRQ